MDTRRLNCLLLGDGRVVELMVHERETRVAELEAELRRQLVRHQGAAAAAAVALELFVARVGDSFLAADSRDAQRLAFRDCRADLEDDRDFLTPAKAMALMDAVHDHFPVQPPCADGAFSLLHVLVRVRRRNHHANNTAPSPMVGPTLCDEHGGAVARVIASARQTRVDPVVAAGNGRGSSNAEVSDPRASLVLRCASPRGVLWLSEDENAKATLFAPPSWRVLAAEIFRWLQLDREARTRGRRAVVVGAPLAGKSAFLGFLLLQLLWLRPPRPVCIVDAPGVAFARVGADRTVLECERGEHFARELQDPQTIYLFDAAVSRGVGPLRPRDVHARSIVVAPHLPSPSSGGLGKRTRAFVLPRWSLAEVRVCRQLCAEGEGCQRGLALLYSKWGGVPGRLCVGALAASEAALERALARLPPERVVAALVTLQRSRCGWYDVATGRDSARWRPLVVAAAAAQEEGEKEVDSPRNVYTGQVAFTSQYVCDRVLARVPLPTWKIRAHVEPPPATPAAMWMQLRASLAYLEGEEEEKHDAPPPAGRMQ